MKSSSRPRHTALEHTVLALHSYCFRCITPLSRHPHKNCCRESSSDMSSRDGHSNLEPLTPVCMTVGPLHLPTYPTVSLESYIRRVVEYMFPLGDDEELQLYTAVTLFYLDRCQNVYDIKFSANQQDTSLLHDNRASTTLQVVPPLINHWSAHRLFFGCALLAVKWLNDYHYSDKFYAGVGGMTISESSMIQLSILHLLDFSIFVNGQHLAVTLGALKAESTPGRCFEKRLQTSDEEKAGEVLDATVSLSHCVSSLGNFISDDE